ncbi:acyl-CoA dehydrogenase family protein [uncultured Eubacterium sp.]|uniref:acyl-CoA dehydrogenase family protein n=1 Tax=uncultured Eubacterium sp. TaxID=165185 RepID=UPI0015A9EAF2|nr:acyl-CoA dehydrogenase family protein [uncultured Eubacterium sp.]
MFELTEDQKAIQEMIRDYAEKEIKPKADDVDKTGAFPADTIAELAEMGVMGLNIPEEYGGVGMDEICKVLAISEIARCCASTAEIVAVHLLVNDIILNNATEEQKAKFLPQAVEGKLGAFCLTEPGAGSDAGGLRTKAVKDGDEYVINGTKCFISNFGPDEGNHFVIITLTDPEKGTRGGMTAFLLERGTPGLKLGKTENKMGMNGAAVSELILEDCRVPESAIMGKVGDGFKIAMSGLDGGRIGIASQAFGLAQGAMEEGIEYAKNRVQFGKPISANQGLQWYIADMATRVEAARLLTLQAAEIRSKGGNASKNASMAKYYAAETATYVCDLALQLHGGYGYMKDYAVERMYRDARILRIYEGTSEVQKIVIAKQVLK